jgi:hypothetical protein
MVRLWRQAIELPGQTLSARFEAQSRMPAMSKTTDDYFWLVGASHGTLLWLALSRDRCRVAHNIWVSNGHMLNSKSHRHCAQDETPTTPLHTNPAHVYMHVCGCWCWLLVLVLVVLLVVLFVVGGVIPATTTPPTNTTHQQHHFNNNNSNTKNKLLHMFSCMLEHGPCALSAQQVLR